MATYHFQFRGTSGWEDIGAAVGEGADAVGLALVELRGQYGGEMPAGCYQAIESSSERSRWMPFELGRDGQLLGGPIAGGD